MKSTQHSHADRLGRPLYEGNFVVYYQSGEMHVGKVKKVNRVKLTIDRLPPSKWKTKSDIVDPIMSVAVPEEHVVMHLLTK